MLRNPPWPREQQDVCFLGRDLGQDKYRALTSAQLFLQKVWIVELTSFRDCWLVRFRKWKV